MTESHQPDADQQDREPELEPEPIKDLDVDEAQTDDVRGGSGGISHVQRPGN